MPTINVLNEMVVKQNGVSTKYKLGSVGGYYNTTDGKFYEDNSYTTEIGGAAGIIYIDYPKNDLYIYKTTTTSFVKVNGGGGSADNIKFGYLNSADGKFYEDDQYTTEIEPDATNIYVGLDNDTIYRYDTTNTEYVSIGGGGGGGPEYQAGFGININNDTIKTTDFVGTQAEWNALPAEDKAKYDFIHITDDTSSIVYKPGHSISDGTTEKTQRDGLVFEGFTVTDDSTNEVTKIAEVPYTAGDGIDITNKEIAVGDEIAKEWTGTQAQWDAIIDKSPYDGWTINITDDQTSGIGVVVDVVEEGNLNAVTSSAVARAVADINNNLPVLSEHTSKISWHQNFTVKEYTDLRKYGKSIALSIEGIMQATGGSSVNIGTLPSNCRPAHAQFITNAFNTTDMYAALLPNGGIEVRNVPTSGSFTVRIHSAFIAQ